MKTERDLLNESRNADALLRADATATETHGMPGNRYDADAQGPVMRLYSPAGPRSSDSELADAYDAMVADPSNFDATARFVALQAERNQRR